MNFRVRAIPFVLVVLQVSCAGMKLGPTPRHVPFEEILAESNQAPRSVSMRLVQEGRQEFSKLHFERAAQKFSRAIEIDASNAFAYFFLGKVRFQTSRCDQAVELFARSLELFDDLPDWKAEAHALRGDCHRKANRLTEAEMSYQKALDLDSENERAREGVLLMDPEAHRV